MTALTIAPEETQKWTEAEYFAYPAVNASSLKQLLKSPKKYQHSLTHSKPPTIGMTLGKVVHCLVFEPNTFAARYAIWEGESRRTKAYREWKERQEMAGRTVITEGEHETALRVAQAASRHPLMLDLLGHSGTLLEVVVVWQGVFGLSKAKIDLLHYSVEHGLIVLDLKTHGAELDEHSLQHTMGRFAVHLQLWHYFEAACAYYDLPTDDVYGGRLIALFAQTCAPHDTTACELGPETVAQVRSLYFDLAQVFHNCKELNNWPGYPNERVIEIPGYYTQLK